MEKSLILRVQSWLADTQGRLAIDSVEPSIPSEEYSIVTNVLSPNDTRQYRCGRRLTYMYSDRPVNYSINAGESFKGDLFIFKLEGSQTGSFFLNVVCGNEKTRVRVVTVD